MVPAMLKGCTVVLLTAASLIGCGGEEADEPSVQGLYRLPSDLAELSEGSWFDHPWPSDYRLENGSPRFTGFHNPIHSPLVAEYLGVAEGLLDGFSPAGAGYLRFDGGIDPDTLPAGPKASLDEGSSVQLFDVGPTSVERGRRRPILVSYWDGEGVYLRPHTLRWLPAFGFPLRPNTRYALVVTDELRGASGEVLRASDELAQVLDLREAAGIAKAQREALAGALKIVAESGVPRERIRHLSVFTTGDPAAEVIAVAKHLREHVAAPTLLAEPALKFLETSSLVEYQGWYGPSPSYQQGAPPYWKLGDGGAFNYVDGEPSVVADTPFRFSLSVPRGCTMPQAGYPVVLYAHGTGGDWRSYLQNGTAGALAGACLASMGVDQIMHGARPGTPDNLGDVQLAFINFQNVEAARTNGRQAAIDEVQRARLFTEGGFKISAAASHDGSEIRFDASKLMYFGHSQGGINGPIYLAIDDSARGGVLSGSAAILTITLVEKTEPKPAIADIIPNILLGLPSEDAVEYDVFHPALMMVQSLLDAVDPIHYGRLSVLEPLDGAAPKSLLMTEGVSASGVGDSFSPNNGIEAHAVALGLPLQEPAQHRYPQLEYGAPGPVQIPQEGLAGNLAKGLASGVLAQWQPGPSDGHHVVFDVAAARAQAVAFLANLAADPRGRVPAP